MREHTFELRLCARLEAEGRLVARQLGGGVARPGGRVVDAVCVEPGPGFEQRAAITSRSIPERAIEADVGAGRARRLGAAFPDLAPERARAVADRAVEVGFFERERRGGHEHVRKAARYPDWFDRLIAVENKPDLEAPGDLESQLRTDVSLAVFDAVVLATGSYVTRAHRNRLPEEVGIWRFDPEGGDLDILREPASLPAGEPGIELVAEHPGRAEVRVVDPGAKARARRRIAERAYGKGWRPDPPGCANARDATIGDVGGLPGCEWHGRLVDPGPECGPGCPGFEPADPPFDPNAERDRTSPWVGDPEGRARRQADLDAFGR